MAQAAVRKERRTASDKRIRILDGAEELFSEKDFDGTNVREIAAMADVPLSLVSYHFPTKMELFDAVIERRADEISGDRLAALKDAKSRKGSDLDIRDILDAYAAPFFRRSAHRNPGWRNYCQLIARVGTSRRWQPVVGKYYDATSEVFTDEIERLYPDTAPDVLHRGFYLVIGAMLLMCADTGRLAVMSGDRYREIRAEQLIAEFDTFVASGFHSLATPG